MLKQMLKLTIMSLLLLSGCATSRITPGTITAIEIESKTDTVIIDGVPDGTNVANIFKNIDNGLASILAENGFVIKNKADYKLIYSITYFGHRWKGLHIKYIINYKAQLIDNKTKQIIKNYENDHMDEDLVTVINRTKKHIASFATDI